MKAPLAVLVVALGAMSLTGCLREEAALDRVGAAGAPSPTGDPFLKPVIQDPHGRVIRLAEYKGKVRVFDVWASWCGPCRMEIPQLNTIYERYRARGLVVVGVSVDDSPADVLEFIRQVPIHYPQGMMNPEVASLLRLGEGGMAIPITLVVDRTGKLRKRFVGLMRPDFLEREIAALL
jgi:cytochrome c biogenesis protein CcmG, thiol:disulfide interchange protein DsbE